MSINLINRSDFTDALYSLICMDPDVEWIPVASYPAYTPIEQVPTKITDLDKQKLSLAQGMATEYLRDRLLQYWSNKQHPAFICALTMDSHIVLQDKKLTNLPTWVKQALNNNEEVFYFNPFQFVGEEQQELRNVGLFLTDMAKHYLDKVATISQTTHRPLKISLEYLKGKCDYTTYEKALQGTLKWRDNQWRTIEQKAKTEVIMRLPHGYSAVRLLNTEALQLEGRFMSNCLGDKKQPHISELNDGIYDFYSIRNAKNQSKMTLKIQKDIGLVEHCLAKANGKVHQKDIDPLCSFLNQTKFTMTDASMDEARVLRGEDGTYYNLFALPKNQHFVIKDLHLESEKLTHLPDLTHVEVTGSFYCYSNELTDLSGAPHSVGRLFNFSNNPIRSLSGFPKSVGSVVSPVLLGAYQERVQNNITISNSTCSNLSSIWQNLMQIHRE